MASDGEEPREFSRENSLENFEGDEPEMYWPDDDDFYDDEQENFDPLDAETQFMPEDYGAWVPAAPPPHFAAAAAAPAALKPKTCRARNWMITLHAPHYENAHAVQGQLDHWEKVRAYAFQEERAPETGRIHLQMYVEFNSVVTNIGIKKAFGEQAHCEPRKKSAQECWNYCTKEETRVAGPWTKGSPGGEQGKRSDLEAIAKEVEAGATARTIARKFPSDFIRYSRGIEKLILIQGGTSSYLREVPRQVLLYYGKTRTGKTHRALTLYPNAWMKPLSRQWMDTYEGQSVAIIDEVCPDMFDLQWFLRLVDNYDIIVESKGGHLLWKPDTVIITSNYKPEEWWQWPISLENGQAATHRGRNVIRHASYEALCARISEVFVFHDRDRVQQLNDDEKKHFFEIGA